MPIAEVLKRQKGSVRNPLPVCYDCLARNIKLPGGGTDFVKKRANAREKKATLTKKALASSREKGHVGR